MSMQYSPYVVAAATMAKTQSRRSKLFLAANPKKKIQDFYSDPREAEIAFTIMTNLVVADEETHIADQI